MISLPRRRRFPTRHILAPAVLLLFLFACRSASSQTTGGSISGTITDQTGAVVPAAKVTALNLDTTVQQNTSTNAEGVYTFANLPVGRYEVQVDVAGFQPVRRTDLVVSAGAELHIDISLTMSAQKQEVVVSAQAEDLRPQTQETQMGEAIPAPTIESTPIITRSLMDVLAIQPAVIPVTTQPSSNIIMAGVTSSPPSGGLNPGNISVSGQPENANGFFVNGSDVEEDTLMGTAVIPNLESVSELRILTNNFDAQYGNFSGGRVMVTTKSGTNQIHGDVFDFIRATPLDAQGYFALTKPTYNQQMFGGTVGGPFKRNKVHWFVDYQGSRITQGIDTGLLSVPSAADHTGNLSDLASTLTGSVGTAFLASQLSSKLGYAVAQGEPYFTPTCTSVSACVFPGAVIPQRAWSAPAAFLLKYIPTPNVGLNQFDSASENQTTRDDKGGVRIDANTRFGNLVAYYFADDYTLNNPYPVGQGGANVPSGQGGTFNALSRGRSQLATFGDVKPIGNNEINEFHFSYMRYANVIGQPLGGVGVSLACQGFVTAIPDPLGTPGCPGTVNTVSQNGIYPLNPSIEGVENISLQSLGITIGTPITNAIQVNNTYQWIDNFTKIVGKHTITFGGEFHYDQINELPNATFNGSFQFNGSQTGSDYADFLLGVASTYVQTDQGAFYPRNKYAGFYGQDSWRVTPNLTLNYGVRWDIISPWYEKYNQLNTLNPAEQSVVFPGAPAGFLVPLDPGVPRTISPTHYDNFAPRLGLAYAPNFKNSLLQKVFGKSGESSIRAGFGVLYTAIPGISADIMYGVPPYGFNYVPNSVLFTQPMCTTNDQCRTQPFPTQPPPFGASPSNPNNTVNWANVTPITADPAFADNNSIPYTEEFYLSYQRQIRKDMLLTLSYVGSQSHHQYVITPFNSSVPSICIAANIANPGSCGPSNDNIARPFWNNGAGFGGDSLQATIGNASYNALESILRYNGTHGSFLASYTYSKCLSDSSGYGEEVLAGDLAYTRAVCSFDIRDNFVLTYTYHLPIATILGNRHNRFTDGWDLSGITRISTGLPVTIAANTDNSLLGTNPNGVNNAYIDRPNYTGAPLNLNYNPANGPAFNAAAFTQETVGTLGTSPRRFFYGPGLVNFDMALEKNIPLTETKSLQFRWEAYNVFNQAQFFAQPDGDPTVQGNFTSPQFGQIIAAMPPRLMQIAVKFLF